MFLRRGVSPNAADRSGITRCTWPPALDSMLFLAGFFERVFCSCVFGFLFRFAPTPPISRFLNSRFCACSYFLVYAAIACVVVLA